MFELIYLGSNPNDVLSLDNKIKKELTKGKKIKVDNIGKFICVTSFTAYSQQNA